MVVNSSTLNIDNMLFQTDDKFDIIFCDYVYENSDFTWAKKYYEFLKSDSVMIAMTDYHTQHIYRWYMEIVLGATFVNHLVWKNEWGNHPKNRFHQCYDDIIIYSNSKNWKFDSSNIQVPKATITKGLNPSGRETKTATAWIEDICLTTVAKERVKKTDGHLIKWQKPLKLYDRILLPFMTKDSNILDPFMGSGSLGKWCYINKVSYVGIEIEKETYNLAIKNITGE